MGLTELLLLLRHDTTIDRRETGAGEATKGSKERQIMIRAPFSPSTMTDPGEGPGP